MTLSIRSRIYFSFLILVSVFIINGIITIVTISNNKKLTDHVTFVIDPISQGLIDFNRILVESKMCTINWVFLRANQEDKNALIEIRNSRYPLLKSKLTLYSSQLPDKSVKDSLAAIFIAFEKLQASQKTIMNALQKFEDYDDPFKRLVMEEKVEDEIVPQTALLEGKLNHVIKIQRALKTQANARLEKSSAMLSNLMFFLAIGIVITGIFLATYLTHIIINPIDTIRRIVADLGLGRIRKFEYKYKNNEMGKMIESVNNLSNNLLASSTFANEIGRKNYNNSFEPLSEDDALGKALVTMRDNLQKSDYRINEAQRIAQLGSWELNLQTKHSRWSDEFYRVLGYSPSEVKPDFSIFLEMVVEEDRPALRALIFDTKSNNEPFAFTCRVLTAKNEIKDLNIQWHNEFYETDGAAHLLGIIQDITEQKKFEETLIKNNNELKKTNLELDKFVYSVSHDLRAPLSSMLGIVQLTEEDVTDPLVQENLGHVKGSILKLDGFIQDILSYSRNSRTEIRKAPVNFEEMLNEIKGDLKYMGGAQSKVEVITHVNQNAEFMSDESRLGIVLNNLISNGIRYHNAKAEKPFVEISVFANQYETQIVVEDNGIGIRKDLHQKIFDMFYRVSENSVGSGLGLYIVKETIETLGGSIAIESEPGSGTKFTINIHSN